MAADAPTPLWVTIVVAAISGGLTGAIASLIAPGSNGPSRNAGKTGNLAERRSQAGALLIAAAPDIRSIRHTATWVDLKPELTKSELEQMASNHIISSPGADTETIKKGILLAVVKRIEKKWKLD